METKDEPVEDQVQEATPPIQDQEPIEAATPPEVSTQTPEERELTRKEKKANRFREAQERAEAAERKAQEAVDRARALELELRNQAQRQPSQAPAQSDPHASELDRIYQEQTVLAQRLNDQNLTRGELDKITERARQLDEQKQSIITRREMQRSGVRPMSDQDMQRAAIQAQYPDIFANDRARRWAMATHHARVAEGHPDNYDLFNRVANEARVKFGLGGANVPPPDAREKSRSMGPPRSGGRAPTEQKTTIRMTPERERMAQGLYPSLPKEEAIRKWAQRVGKKVLAAESASES